MPNLSDAYCHQLLNPWDKSCLVRYPDDTMLPTALMSLHTRIRRNASGTPNSPNQDVTTALFVKPSANDPIWIDQPGGAYSGTNYGSQSTAYGSSSTSDRTLAAAIRITITGLADTSVNEVPSGGAYMVRLTSKEYNTGGYGGAITEQDCLDLVENGKAFYVPFNRLIHMPDGMTIPYLPFGPNSFLFSDTQPNVNSIPVAGQDQVATTPGVLMVYTFGGPKNMEFTFDYGHVVEYIPTVTAAPLVHARHQQASQRAQNNIVKNVERLFTHLFSGQFNITNNMNFSNMFNSSSQTNSMSIGRYAGSITRNTANYFESGIAKAAPEIAEAAIML